MKGTLIHTYKGLKPIEDIKIGELVLTHENRFRPVIQLHRNHYEGMLYDVNNNNSWMTGNHPVLTLRGWIDSETLNEGEHIIQIKPMSIKTVDRPASVRQSLLLSPILSNLPGGTMPVSTIHFNSDFNFRNSEVNIKNTKGILRNNLHPSLLEDTHKHLFETTEPMLSLNTLGSRNKHFMSLMAAPNFIMKGLNLIGSLLRSHLRPSKKVGLTPPSDMDTAFKESTPNGSSGTPIFGGESLLGHPAFIETNQLRDRKVNPFHIASTIYDIDRMLFKGDVFNISVLEDESYVVGENGIVVHNCRCWFESKPADDKRARTHFGLTAAVWTPLSQTAKFALLVSFIEVLEKDPDFIECVKKEMEKGKTEEAAKKICRSKEYRPAEMDEIARFKLLASNLTNNPC